MRDLWFFVWGGLLGSLFTQIAPAGWVGAFILLFLAAWGVAELVCRVTTRPPEGNDG